ncbi:MAG: DUF5050 domain-containing protein [Clostridiaceae bacterium]|nr:DUF5050 domain-containing protein [Clostridiaceae bacterium]
MKKSFGLLIGYILIGVSLMGCVASNINLVKDTGNTAGNIINGGNVVKLDALTYFSKPGEGLYKLEENSGMVTKLTDGRFVEYINIANEEIYYIDRGHIYKMDTDGTNKFKVRDAESEGSNAHFLYVVEDKLFYKTHEGLLYLNNQLVLPERVHTMAIVDELIYYIALEEQWNIYKVEIAKNLFGNITVNNKEKLNDDYSNWLNVQGDWVYYVNESDENSLYKIKTDGTQRTKLNDRYSWGVNVLDDWIYYVSREKSLDTEEKAVLYKMNISDKEEIKIHIFERIGNIQVIEDWIYYYEGSNEDLKLFRVKNDGSNKQLIY